jgi:DmsE family decaheme c-type cytochrome
MIKRQGAEAHLNSWRLGKAREGTAECASTAIRLGLLAARGLAAAVLLFSSFQLAQAQATLVGNDVCGACHEDVYSAFRDIHHRESDCEDCHGPGSQHVEAGGGLTLSFTAQPADWATLQCLHCHQDNAEHSGFLGSAHGRNSVSCVACHQVHPTPPNFGLLKGEQKDLCTSCHPATRADFRKPFHHPVLEGAILCSDCHSSHTEDDRSLRPLALGPEEGCLSCHSDKKGPFVFEHPPSKVNGCATCHEPHGSINPKMLRRTQVAQLCLECHSMTPGVATSQPPAFHDIRTARFRNCTVCHREIHGSNVDPDFFR